MQCSLLFHCLMLLEYVPLDWLVSEGHRLTITHPTTHTPTPPSCLPIIHSLQTSAGVILVNKNGLTSVSYIEGFIIIMIIRLTLAFVVAPRHIIKKNASKVVLKMYLNRSACGLTIGK